MKPTFHQVVAHPAGASATVRRTWRRCTRRPLDTAPSSSSRATPPDTGWPRSWPVRAGTASAAWASASKARAGQGCVVHTVRAGPRPRRPRRTLAVTAHLKMATLATSANPDPKALLDVHFEAADGQVVGLSKVKVPRRDLRSSRSTPA